MTRAEREAESLRKLDRLMDEIGDDADRLLFAIAAIDRVIARRRPRRSAVRF